MGAIVYIYGYISVSTQAQIMCTGRLTEVEPQKVIEGQKEPFSPFSEVPSAGESNLGHVSSKAEVALRKQCS